MPKSKRATSEQGERAQALANALTEQIAGAIADEQDGDVVAIALTHMLGCYAVATGMDLKITASNVLEYLAHLARQRGLADTHTVSLEDELAQVLMGHPVLDTLEALTTVLCSITRHLEIPPDTVHSVIDAALRQPDLGEVRIAEKPPGEN